MFALTDLEIGRMQTSVTKWALRPLALTFVLRFVRKHAGYPFPQLGSVIEHMPELFERARLPWLMGHLPRPTLTAP